MTKRQTEQIKIYALLSLAAVAAVVAYIRFGRGRVGAPEGQATEVVSMIPSGVLRVPDFIEPRPPSITASAADTNAPVAMRDIFSPPPPPPEPEPDVVAPEPERVPPARQVSGIIRQGERLIANVNGRFVEPGDWLGDARIVDISAEGVTIDSADGLQFLPLNRAYPSPMPRPPTDEP